MVQPNKEKEWHQFHALADHTGQLLTCHWGHGHIWPLSRLSSYMPQDQYIWTHLNIVNTQHSDCLQSVPVCFTVCSVQCDFFAHYSIANPCLKYLFSKCVSSIFIFLGPIGPPKSTPRSTKVATFSDQKKRWKGSIDNAGQPSDFGSFWGCTRVSARVGMLV